MEFTVIVAYLHSLIPTSVFASFYLSLPLDLLKPSFPGYGWAIGQTIHTAMLKNIRIRYISQYLLVVKHIIFEGIFTRIKTLEPHFKNYSFNGLFLFEIYS